MTITIEDVLVLEIEIITTTIEITTDLNSINLNTPGPVPEALTTKSQKNITKKDITTLHLHLTLTNIVILGKNMTRSPLLLTEKTILTPPLISVGTEMGPRRVSIRRKWRKRGG